MKFLRSTHPYLPSKVRGQHFYLYLVEDLFSRYGVMWEVHERESGELAAELIQKALWREKCLIHKPVLHSDNGSPMKSQTMRTKLQEWGVTASHSRPGVSDELCPSWV